jgi:RND family efflux transporter MFP subunit
MGFNLGSLNMLPYPCTKQFTQLLTALLLLTHSACSPNPAPPNEQPESKLPIAAPATIRHTPATLAPFPLRSFSTGILQATLQTELKTKTSGLLLRLEASEHRRFQKGDLLAQLDPSALQLQLEQARLQLEEATFNKNDLIALGGGKFGDDGSVSAEVLNNIEIQSGYKKARHAIKQIEYELEQVRLLAPFSGTVADVKAKPHQQVGAGETLCRLIDPLSYEAVFFLLEKEAMQAGVGQPVRVQPVADPTVELQATVSAINPVVDERGLVRIHARIRPDDLRRHSARLLEGMNIRAVLEKRLPNQLVVPKSAVVLRSGKPVVFTYDEASGLAKWNYVTVLHENDTHAAIGDLPDGQSGGLRAGDLVIYEGNLNLDHDAKVTVGSPQSTVGSQQSSVHSQQSSVHSQQSSAHSQQSSAHSQQ